MQSLFEWDFNGNKKGVIGEIVERNAEEFAPGTKNLSFLKALADGVVKEQAKLDRIIEKAAPEWPLPKISTVDRNILRIGLHELLYGDRKEVPPKVAINEAIELAKTFGGENSGKFVNGVLGAVYKELGEPGKDEVSKKKRVIDPKKLPLDKLIGAFVYAKKGKEVYLGLIHDVFGRWTLTKGHLKDGENEEDGVVRKAREEMGAIITKIVDALGVNEYIASDPKKGKIRKQVHYFIAEAKFTDLRPEESGGGIDGAQWFKLADVVNLNMYDDILPIIAHGIEKLKTAQ